MVGPDLAAIARVGCLLVAVPMLMGAAANDTGPLLDRLDPVLRARLLMTLLGLILVGLALVVCIRLGARYLRRTGGPQERRETPSDDDWFTKPLAPPGSYPREPDPRDPSQREQDDA